MKLRFWDTTLRDGEQAPGFALGKDQKVKVALYLEEIGVDTIEAGMPANYDHDFESVRAVAKAVCKSEVAAFARATPEDIELAARALEGAQKPVILTFTPAYDQKLTSMGWSRQQGIDYAVKAVDKATKYVPQVSFGAEFSTKADRDYLICLFNEVVAAGATRIVIADTTGCMLPNQFGLLVKDITEKVQGNYILSLHCHNDLGLAIANPLQGIEHGAQEVHTTINGIGERAGNTSLETLAHALLVGQYRVETNLEYKAIVPNSKKIADIFRRPIPLNTPVVGDNAFATAAGIHIKGGSLYLEIDPEEVYGIKPKLVKGPHSGSFSEE